MSAGALMPCKHTQMSFDVYLYTKRIIKEIIFGRRIFSPLNLIKFPVGKIGIWLMTVCCRLRSSLAECAVSRSYWPWSKNKIRLNCFCHHHVWAIFLIDDQFFVLFHSTTRSESVQTYSFVLTSDDSKWRFGFCRHDTKVQNAMIIITYLPWHDTFIKFLNVLGELKRANNGEFQPFLSEAYIKGVPEPGASLKLFYNNAMSVSLIFLSC